MNYVGCAWYPEAWAPERWEIDVQLMKKAGFNAVRIGEFNWGRFEPQEGEFNLTTYQDVLALLERYGMSALMGTPTAAPPKWMSHRYPEILKTDAMGMRVSDGNRRHYCPSSMIYRKFSRRIVRKLAETFAHSPVILGWQLDNELAAEAETGLCFCETCRQAFIQYLKHRYGTVEQLNRAWNGSFWSGDFSSFDNINPRALTRLPGRLDYRQFMSSQYVNFAYEQRDILRQINPQWKITTNSWTTYLPDVAPDEVFAGLDSASCDSYIQNDRIEATHAFWDYYRNVKGRPQPFAIAETSTTNPVTNHPDAPKAVGAWAWDALAHGVENLFYFRWRQSVMGEEDHPSILPCSGHPGRTYDHLAATIREIARFNEKHPELPLPECSVAILVDRQTGFIAQEKQDYSYYHMIVRTVKALNEWGVQTDIIPSSHLSEAQLKPYKLLILPKLNVLSEQNCGLLMKFYREGGRMFALGQLNRRDDYGKYLSEPYPVHLRETFGLHIDEIAPICSHADPNDFDYTEDRAQSSHCNHWLDVSFLGEKVRLKNYMELLIPEDCKVLQTYTDGLYQGAPLFTEHKGAYYLGSEVDDRGLKKALEIVLRASGFELMEIPARCCRMKRGPIVFFLNNTPQQKMFAEDGVILPPYGCAWQENGITHVIGNN